jgi:hypothetical protein
MKRQFEKKCKLARGERVDLVSGMLITVQHRTSRIHFQRTPEFYSAISMFERHKIVCVGHIYFRRQIIYSLMVYLTALSLVQICGIEW